MITSIEITRRSPMAIAAAIGLFLATDALAQQTTPPPPDDQEPDSTEQGQTTMDKSFGPRTHY
jgi:hypothetical protein